MYAGRAPLVLSGKSFCGAVPQVKLPDAAFVMDSFRLH